MSSTKAPLSSETKRALQWVTSRTCNVPSVTLQSGEVVYQTKYYPVKGPVNPVHIDRKSSLGQFHVLSFHDLTGLIDDYFYPNIGDILAIGCCSRAWNWYTSNEKLWKYFTKAFTKGNIDFIGTWKQSLVRHLNRRYHMDHGDITKYNPSPVERVDLSVAPYWTGMEAELLRSFKLWYRSAVNPRYWEVSCPRDIDRIHWKDISVQEFIEKYEIPGKPVIIAGVAEQWAAPKFWNEKTFTERHGEEVWRCGSGWKMKMTRYFQYLKTRSDPLPLYLFDRRYPKIAPEIYHEYKIPDYFPEDYFSIVGEKDRPPYRWILIGPGGSTVPFHVDPQGTSAWNVVVRGKKRWGFYPPGVQPPEVGEYDSRYYNAPSGLKWLLNVLPTLKADELPVECLQEEGDLLFVPSGWWHLVYNIPTYKEDDDGLCIAMTHNYCSTHNFHRIAALFCGEPRCYFGRRFKESLPNFYPELYQKWLEIEKIFKASRESRNELVVKWGLVLPLLKEGEEPESSGDSSSSSLCE